MTKISNHYICKKKKKKKKKKKGGGGGGGVLKRTVSLRRFFSVPTAENHNDEYHNDAFLAGNDVTSFNVTPI